VTILNAVFLTKPNSLPRIWMMLKMKWTNLKTIQTNNVEKNIISQYNKLM